MTDQPATLLNSKELLDKSIECISNGMDFENNNDLEEALRVYTKGQKLLSQAADIETNNDVLPIISSNLQSVQLRIDSLSNKLRFDQMVNNLHQSMADASSNILNQFDDDNQLINVDTDNDNSTDIDIIDPNISIDDANILISNLYEQYYGDNNKYDKDNNLPISDTDDDKNNLNLNDTTNKNVLTSDHNTHKNVSGSDNLIKHKTVSISDHINHKNVSASDIDNKNKSASISDIDNINWNNFNKQSSLIIGLQNDIIGYIFSFLSSRELTKLFIISKMWCYCLLYDISFIYLWKRIIIGADPIRNILGHNLNLKWLSRKICGSIIRKYINTLIISTAGLALDNIINRNKRTPDYELYILRKYAFPRLKILVFYGWESINILSLKLILKYNLLYITSLFLESSINILDICLNTPNLSVLHCNVVNCSELQLISKHKFINLKYITFIYGVDDYILNRIFYSFPNLVHCGLEFDEITTSLTKLLQNKLNYFNVFHMSWNYRKFWGINKDIGQSHIKNWLKCIGNIKCLILDRDYMYDDDDNIGQHIQALSDLQQLLPYINMTICEGSCTYNLKSFANFCNL